MKRWTDSLCHHHGTAYLINHVSLGNLSKIGHVIIKSKICFLLTIEWISSLVCIHFPGKLVTQLVCFHSFFSSDGHYLHLRVYNTFSCKLYDLNFPITHFYSQQENWRLEQLHDLFQLMWTGRRISHTCRFLFNSLVSMDDVTLPIYNLYLLYMSRCQACPFSHFLMR